MVEKPVDGVMTRQPASRFYEQLFYGYCLLWRNNVCSMVLTTDWKGFAAHRMIDGRVDVSIWNSSTAYYEVLHIAVELGKVYAAKGNFDRNGNITFGLRDSRKIENSYQSVKKSLANKTAQSVRHSYGLR